MVFATLSYGPQAHKCSHLGATRFVKMVRVSTPSSSDEGDRQDQVRQTGRPRVADPACVAAVGLRLFDAQGMDNTTMTQIAEAAGISRTTLLRYFPTKTDLLWHRMLGELKSFEVALEELQTTADPVMVVCRAAAEILDYSDDEIGILRTQVKILASSEGGAESLPPRISALRDVIVDSLSTHLGWDRNGLETQLLARTVTGAGWTALLVWVDSDELRPERLLSEALRRVEEGFARS